MDSKTIINLMQEWLHLKNKAIDLGLDEPPIPAELFSADQMERYGITLALSHTLTQKKIPDKLLKRLSISEDTVTQSCAWLTKDGNKHDSFSPAREWLLDNFYLIQEQIQSIRRNLPKGYGKALPKLATGMPDYPRIYDIALQVIEHNDGRWDLENLSLFIEAYQSVTLLTLGELWALPITLGIALIENLSNVSRRIVSDRHDHNLAEDWAEKMIEVAMSDPKKLDSVIADLGRSKTVMSSAFVAELARRLQGTALVFPLNWIEHHLADEGLSIEQLVQKENKNQAANQVSVSNCIAGLRHLAEVNWRDLVEKMSIVEKVLRSDPTGTYANMDFDTRDRYRHVIERLSRVSAKTEYEVSTMAIQIAKNSLPYPIRYSHVGYYLIGDGLPQLEKALHISFSFWKKFKYFAGKWSLQLYLGSIIFITSILTFALVNKAIHNRIEHTEIEYAWIWILGIAIVLAGSQLAISVVNLAATLFIKPKTLAKMDFTKGIPISGCTLVIVPSMLGSVEGVESLIEALEVRYLGNRDENLLFGLLTDFNDASEENMPEDAQLLSLAEARITALNEYYVPNKENNIFYLFHRPRLWNANEQIWMGKERKRGKLSDLNNLLRGNDQTPFVSIIGSVERLKNVKYVITLDSDTLLPRESARKLVSTMLHPLNIPRFDEDKQRVVEGYGILQPRIVEALPTTGINRYIKLCGNEFGIDPYTRSISDVYQDVFEEGSFVGKGIYDVDLFQKVLGYCLPNNRILSHDLLEGCYLRSGFVSDIELFEKSPSSYFADVKRRIRWIRGDWQLFPWLFPKIRNGNGEQINNPLSMLSKFKLLDNLRRSVVPIAQLLLFGLTWTVLPATLFWMMIMLIIIVLPAMINTFIEFLRKPSDMYTTQHIWHIARALRHRLAQLILYLSCLPHEATYSLIAILRTAWRLSISKRRLLEWVPSDQVDQRLKDNAKTWFAEMWMGPVIAVITLLILLLKSRYQSLLFASPLLILWFISPFIASWVSRPYKRIEQALNSDQTRFLHQMARITWEYFNTFVTANDHWLPPDNYQETPIEVLARRTSPTNIGMSLLANLTAYDFGYIQVNQLLERTQQALSTLHAMERYRGHFYNWYSTETLKPLLPRYVSTVDSGNLAGHMLTLRQGLLALPEQPILTMRALDGLQDTLDVLAKKLIHTQVLNPFQHQLQAFRLSLTHWTFVLNGCQALVTAAEKLLQQVTQSEMATRESAINDIVEWTTKLLLQCRDLCNEIHVFSDVDGLTAKSSLRDLSIHKLNLEARRRIKLIDDLADQLLSLAQMDMSFLYDDSSHLMTIGFNVDEQHRDSGRYDLLSSEARLGCFVAIAQGQAKEESWFALGRRLVVNGGEPTLISWSGSMFEYLMPLLVMPSYPGTLLDQTYRSAVNRQIAYGKQHQVPWGISESGYNAVDTQFNYLYRAFGVPGLGLKRGLAEDLVIAPYASAMALMVNPIEACANLQRLAKEYALGKYGFYEAIDFTKARLPRENKRVLIRSFMAHHQGMAFLAYSYLLHEQPMQRRFIADPLIQATLLLLQEKIPRATVSHIKIPESPIRSSEFNQSQNSTRIFHTPHTRTPQIQLLSNGRYHVALTQAGGGYSRWKDLAITRWREDSTCDNWGLFIYIRDVESEQYWSTSYQPTLHMTKNFKTILSQAHVEFSGTELLLDMHTEISISPEDDVELRRLRIHNRSKMRRTIEFTSYAEVVLAPQASDLSQPAFNNLFIETELLTDQHAILATRRPQDAEQSPPWLCHLLNVYSDESYSLSYETDRSRFIGRGNTLTAPLAMTEPGDLSNTQGAVLDPIVSIRCRITLEPDALVTFDLLNGVAETRLDCIGLIEKYQDRRLANRIFGLAWTHSQVLLHQLNISEADAQLYGKLASAILYSNTTRRADAKTIASNRKRQSDLWKYSISGDVPIVVVHIEYAENIELIKQLIQAQIYWRRKGLKVDLIILNEERVSYRQILQDQILSLMKVTFTAEQLGCIIVLLADQVSSEDLRLFQSVARVILSDKRGTLKEQLNRRRVTPPLEPALVVPKMHKKPVHNTSPFKSTDLQFFNGLGGFNSKGDEYVIRLKEGMTTPAPWANVIANPNFGTIVSESGQGYTWVENAHEFRLTPWENDPLQDLSGEAFYLRDDDTGLIWSPTVLPCRGKGDYQTRHGFGYSVFEHVEQGIHSELTIFVAEDASIKFFILKLRNHSMRHRRISVTGYMALVLGDLRSKNTMHVVTELSQSGAILAYNHYNAEFENRVGFFDAVTQPVGLNERTVTGDRTEFLGRNGTMQKPAALTRQRLSNRVGAGLDPCAAIQLAFDLRANQSRDILFTLGAAEHTQGVETLLKRYQSIFAAEASLKSVQHFWKEILKSLHVWTPDPALNLMANGWLLYQVLSSRLWGRSGYYQSGGAFGFRDQLQDVMSLTHTAASLFRKQILLCAAHQFEEGDVQHWWHPPQNRGVRTRCSDDYLWLPFAICHYIESTGDFQILNENIPYLKGRLLNPGEESYYDLPIMGSQEEAVSLYQHAVAAIRHGLRFGEHGLPLMGSGDWNDGMSLVGIEGRGESVWLGFFLYDVLQHFVKIAEDIGDEPFAKLCLTESEKLKQNLDKHAWDGKWYRRAYFDDGTPMGSASNTECRIDSIAQSWSVLSEVADPKRADTALNSLYQYLVKPHDGIVKLLDPPFDKSKPNPGYIEGYLPGIRENGGQYTHAAIWAAMAFAKLGETTPSKLLDQRKAWQIFHMLNPINHGRSAEEIARYKIEPYVIAADIYSVAPHIGRGGWSWYTGSAGWFYRLITETLLGIRLKNGNHLYLTPIMPNDWNEFSMQYFYGKNGTKYQIRVERGVHSETSLSKNHLMLDEVTVSDNFITLVDDEQEHFVKLIMIHIPDNQQR